VNGQTNVITVSVSDKRGGSSTASLNIYSRPDGTLLVREDLANKPIITALQATRTRDGRVFLRASARDPGGSLLRYNWSASAGSLSVNGAATTLWSGPEQVGSVMIRLSVSNAAGLQSDETLRFERQADGALLGNFSGADLIVGVDGALLPEPALKINTPLLFVRNDQLWRYQTQTRELKQLFSLAELTPPVGVAQQQLNRLLRDPEGQQVHLIYVQNFSSNQRQLGWISVDLATGEARQVDTARKTTLPGELTFYPDENQLLFVRQGKRYAISSLQGPDGGYWLTDFAVSRLYRKLPENFAPIAVSPQGVVLGSDTTQSDQLQAWDSETEQLTDVLKPSALNFNPSAFNQHQLAWDPSGRQFALLSQQWVARENQVELHVCTLAGECRRRWRTVGLRQYQRPEWSPDGRFLSVIEVPLNSTPAGMLKVYDLEQPDQFLDTGETFAIGQYWDTVWGS
jgi:hypothetical protein